MSDETSVGTVRWFGASWGAPVNDPRTHVETPTGRNCEDCGGPIRDGHRGVGTPFVGRLEYDAWYHLDCFLCSIGAEVTREVLNQPIS